MGKYKTLYAESLLSGAPASRHAAGPVQHALADAVSTTLASLQCAVGAGCVWLVVSDMEVLPVAARFAVGSGGILLAFTAVADVVGPTLSQVCDKATEMTCEVIEAWRGTPVQTTSTTIERDRLRVVPLRSNAKLLPIIQLPDGREIDGALMLEFLKGVRGSNLSSPYWKGRGWSQDNWEIARDVLAMHGLATPRENGRTGKMLASTEQCIQVIGL